MTPARLEKRGEWTMRTFEWQLSPHPTPDLHYFGQDEEPLLRGGVVVHTNGSYHTPPPSTDRGEDY
jgi:hypothetical protein